MVEPVRGPQVVVLSSLFPSSKQPGAGLFVRERMFRVAQHLPLCVVSPRPWFPLQGLIARFRPGFRPMPARHEHQRGIDVWFPRFLSVPGLFKRWDGLLMALGAYPSLRRLKKSGRLDLLDAHFGYPDGYAATWLGRWLNVPVSITMRGTEQRHAADPALAPRLRSALLRAQRVFAVSDSLRQIGLSLGVPVQRMRVVGNGVDLDKFQPQDRDVSRRRLGLDPAVPVLISVGGLVERKGFHRVMACMPALLGEFKGLQLLVVGGASPEGDWSDKLRQLAVDLGLAERVHFLGPRPPEELAGLLSAADVFVLATRNEGWANVLLEAMACGLPVVTTDVGGNPEVVCDASLGLITPFGDETALRDAMAAALRRNWDRAAIRAYAADNTWHQRVEVLVAEFRQLSRHADPARSTAPSSGPPH